MENLGDILKRLKAQGEIRASLGSASPTDQAAGFPAPSCAICAGIGWVSHEVPIGHPDFGRAFPCDCQLERYLRERPGKLWEMTGIPRRFQAMTLASSPQAELAAVLGAASADSSWLLWGDKGVGKTGLAVGYARRMIYEFGLSVQFYALPDLLAALRATYDRGRQHDPESHEPTEQELIDYWVHVPLLMLDDMGAEQVSGSGWIEDRLYQIIGRRHADLKPVFITSNLSPSQLGARLGDRTLWRIAEMCGEGRIVQVVGPNLRAWEKP